LRTDGVLLLSRRTTRLPGLLRGSRVLQSPDRVSAIRIDLGRLGNREVVAAATGRRRGPEPKPKFRSVAEARCVSMETTTFGPAEVARIRREGPGKNPTALDGFPVRLD
jgi:hypothetical protein